jgi:hypothetical protein
MNSNEPKTIDELWTAYVAANERNAVEGSFASMVAKWKAFEAWQREFLRDAA